MAKDFLVGDGFYRRNDTEEQFFDKNVQKLSIFGCANCSTSSLLQGYPLVAPCIYPGGLVACKEFFSTTCEEAEQKLRRFGLMNLGSSSFQVGEVGLSFYRVERAGEDGRAWAMLRIRRRNAN
jgi:hypothetical protein